MDQHRCVFVVESDPKMAALLAGYLRGEGFIPCIFSDGRVAVAAVRNDTPAAVILDIGLSGMRGVAICDAVRELSSVPILVLTGCVEEADILRGIDCQVDSYVCKPFGPREVVAQLHEIIRRAKDRTQHRPAYHPRVIDAERTRAVWQRGSTQPLTVSEFRLSRP